MHLTAFIYAAVMNLAGRNISILLGQINPMLTIVATLTTFAGHLPISDQSTRTIAEPGFYFTGENKGVY